MGTIGDAKGFSLGPEVSPSMDVGNIGGNQDFGFGSLDFEKLTRHPSGDAK